MASEPFEKFLPALSVDCVIFGFHENMLKVLLLRLKRTDLWALPGGFIEKKEPINEAAVRVLKKRTGLDKIFLHQFKVFGETDRIPDWHNELLSTSKVIPENMRDWFDQRFVTVGYYALVEYSKVFPQPDVTSETCDWYSLEELPQLMLDHSAIIEAAHQELKRNLNSQPIGIKLLPNRFTMPELQSLYETILGRKLDRRNFQRKILSYDILIRTDQTRKGGSHKAPWLYEFNKEQFNQAIKDGLKGAW